MDADTVLGFVFIVLGAICGGSFGLPSKFAGKDTAWENLWGLFFLFATIIIPVALGPVVVKDLFSICRTAGVGMVVRPVVFGLLWGFGSMALGLSFAFIGLSLAYAINYGGQIAFGSIVPILIHNREVLASTKGYTIIAGVVVCLMGIVVSGRAGVLKASSLAKVSGSLEEHGSKRPRIFIGQVTAFASGILCACYAVAFSFGGDVMGVSETQFGNSGWVSTFVVTALILWGGSVSACGYCVYKLTVNGTWGGFAKRGIVKVLLLALVMACLHDGAIVFWGLGVPKLGPLGVSVGYASFMSLCIIMGNVNGFLTGEWKGASRESVGWIAAGIAVLIGGVCILAKANAMV